MNRLSVVVFDHYCGVDVATKLGVHDASARAEISVGTEAVQGRAGAEREEWTASLALSWSDIMQDGESIKDG